jgi:hypothetical protein
MKEDDLRIVLTIRKASINEWLDNLEQNVRLGIIKIEEIIIDQEKGYKVINTFGEWKDLTLETVIAKNNYLYSFTILFPSMSGEKIFNQMLSTFRFLE